MLMLIGLCCGQASGGVWHLLLRMLLSFIAVLIFGKGIIIHTMNVKATNISIASLAMNLCLSWSLLHLIFLNNGCCYGYISNSWRTKKGTRPKFQRYQELALYQYSINSINSFCRRPLVAIVSAFLSVTTNAFYVVSRRWFRFWISNLPEKAHNNKCNNQAAATLTFAPSTHHWFSFVSFDDDDDITPTSHVYHKGLWWNRMSTHKGFVVLPYHVLEPTSLCRRRFSDFRRYRATINDTALDVCIPRPSKILLLGEKVGQ